MEDDVVRVVSRREGAQRPAEIVELRRGMRVHDVGGVTPDGEVHGEHLGGERNRDPVRVDAVRHPLGPRGWLELVQTGADPEVTAPTGDERAGHVLVGGQDGMVRLDGVVVLSQEVAACGELPEPRHEH